MFTAPVTGKYLFIFNVLTAGLTSSHIQGYLTLVTSNRSYYFSNINVWAINVGGTPLAGTIIADMDAGDTAHLEVYVQGGTKVVDVYGDGSTYQTIFQGYLLP